MEQEFGDVGRMILEKQCADINVDPRNIKGEHLPRLSRILSGLVARYGDVKAKRVSMAINNLRIHELEEEEMLEYTCSACNATIGPNDKSCPNCGVRFSGHDSTPKVNGGIEVEHVCPVCRATTGPDAKSCPRCGATFATDDDDLPKLFVKDNSEVEEDDDAPITDVSRRMRDRRTD